VVTDVGIPNIVRGDWLKKGAVVIDMGTNQVKVTTKFFLHIFKFPLASECMEVLEEVSFMTDSKFNMVKKYTLILMLNVCPFEITYHVVMTIHLDHPKIVSN